MARLETPNDGEPYDPKLPPPPAGMQVAQVSDPDAELKRRQIVGSRGQALPSSPQAEGPKKKLVHPFPLGQVHDHTMNPPRQVIGQAANPKAPEKTFELSVLPNGAPCVQSNQTGNFWVIGWDMLIKLGLAEGIERMVKPPKPKLVDVTGRQISSGD